ncbi:MAG: glycosyltransferase family 1 protein [Candidatus Zixiibacteriota bacterium]
MKSVACDISSFARNPFGGVSQVCFHTVRQLEKFSDLALTGFYTKGDVTSLNGSSIDLKRIRPWTSRFSPEYDIVHSLCHRKLEIEALCHIYTVHDAWSLKPNAWQSPEFQQKLESRMRPEIADADLVLTGSEWTRMELLALDAVDPDRCFSLPNGIIIPEPTMTRTQPIKMRESTSPYVLFVGRLENRKNIPHILEAVRPFADLKLVLVGEPGFGFDEGIEEEIGKFPADRLMSLSRVSPAELLWLYENTLVTLLPSWEEGFGLPMLEAMAAGSPVITSDRSGCAEIARGAAFMVDPGEPEQSRRAIEQIRDDAKFRGQLVSDGKRRASEYTWTRYGKSLKEWYDRMMASQ